MAGQPDRLKKRPEFLRVASRGRKVAVPGLVLQALEREDDDKPRVGFTVTKKVGNSVVRNRTRRRLREALRVVAVDNDLPSVDLVLIGRDATRKRAFDDLVGDLYRALRKSGVMP